MNALRLRALLICLLMAASAAAAHYLRPSVKLADNGPKIDLEALFPAAFGDWKVDDRAPVVLPSPDVQAKLDAIYNQVLSRAYVNGKGERIMLSVAYGGDQSDGTSAHRPEVCYPAQGFQILSNRLDEVRIGERKLPVRRLVSKLGARHEPITYWIVVGDDVVTSGTEQKLAQLRYGVRGLIPDGMLVRVSSLGTDVPAAFELQDRFVNDLFLALDDAQRLRVGGA